MYWIRISELRARCQKIESDYVVYPLLLKLLRVISIYFTWLLIQTRCKPNTITIFGVIFGVLSGVTFFYGFVGIALTLVTLAVIADFSDGEVSRFQGTTSKEGTYLDSIHHYVVQPFFIAGIVLWGFEKNSDHNFLAAGMVSVINSILLPLAIASAVDSALLKHLLRHIKTSENIYKYVELVDSTKNQKQKNKLYRAIPGTVAMILDFPYVILIFGIGAALMHYANDSMFNLNGNLLLYLIYTYAFLSSSLICIFIWNVVHSKHVEKKLAKIINLF
jgi:phosphatidylglycerophosphate synthase